MGALSKMASILTPSNKKGISDLKDEVVEARSTNGELLESIDSKLTEVQYVKKYH
tara:strand:+ start:2372 stop:2536 length:165 start_codon:yes stop_codon:yes gene_type:complete